MPLLFLPKKEVCQEDTGCTGEVDQEMESADAKDDVHAEPAVPGDGGDGDAVASEEPRAVAEEQQSVPAPVIEPVPSAAPAVSSEEGARGPPPERHQPGDSGSVEGSKGPAPREEHPPPVHSTPATERGRGSAEQLTVPEPVIPAPVVDNRPAWKKTKYAHLFE